MDRKEMTTEAVTWMSYHLNNYATAKEVGSPDSAQRNLDEAAKWSAIYTALKQMEG